MTEKYPICFICEYCFRDDNYGSCCVNEKSEHYTRNWSLRVQTECEYFKEEDWE